MESRGDQVFERGKLINLKIEPDGHATEIYFDGKKVTDVMAFTIKQNAQENIMIKLTLNVECLRLSKNNTPDPPQKTV